MTEVQVDRLLKVGSGWICLLGKHHLSTLGSCAPADSDVMLFVDGGEGEARVQDGTWRKEARGWQM